MPRLRTPEIATAENKNDTASTTIAAGAEKTSTNTPASPWPTTPVAETDSMILLLASTSRSGDTTLGKNAFHAGVQNVSSTQ